MNAEDLVTTFKRNMVKLSKTERRRAVESVRDVIRAAMFEDASGSDHEVQCCPRCDSVAIVKKGRSRNGEQRYLCRDCGRAFGMGSERILGTSKLPKETWMAYAECFVLMLPLRERAERAMCASRPRTPCATASSSACRRIPPRSRSSGDAAASSPTTSAAPGPASFSTWPRSTWTIGVPRGRSRLKWWHRGIRER